MAIPTGSCARTASWLESLSGDSHGPEATASGERARQGTSGVAAQTRRGAGGGAPRGPELASFIYSTILHHDRLEQAVVHRIGERLDHSDVPAELIRQAYA